MTKKTKEEEIRLLIANSGNNFHCKVINYFSEKKWDMLISPYYMDSFSEKPREIDLIAQYAHDFKNEFGSAHLGTAYVKLFVECKYIPTNTNTVFWFGEKDEKKTKNLITSNSAFRENTLFIDRHHYFPNKEVAKLFASNGGKSQEGEPFFKAITQCLNAFIYKRHQGPIVEDRARRHNPGKRAFLEYPVIVCSSFENFYKVPVVGDSEPEKITDNFLLEVNYAYLGHNDSKRDEYFLIDVIEFDKLDKYLEALDTEVQANIFLLRN